jgi:hypothetical protein
MQVALKRDLDRTRTLASIEEGAEGGAKVLEVSSTFEDDQRLYDWLVEQYRQRKDVNVRVERGAGFDPELERINLRAMMAAAWLPSRSARRRRHGH